MRIIGGKWKGKTLATFNLDHIRPTSDNVKEAMFSTLQFELVDSSFLDLFGGTGNVGLEAKSRGAGHVVICDNNAKSIEVIEKNKQMLQATDVHVVPLDFRRALGHFALEEERFDIIFIDPPYDTEFGLEAIKQIYENNILADDGIICFEHCKDKKLELPTFCKIYKQKTYGIKQLTYIEF